MKKSLYIIKKIVRKLYHLIWFLSVFIFIAPNVNALNTTNWSVNTTPFLAIEYRRCGNYDCLGSALGQNYLYGYYDTDGQSFRRFGVMNQTTSSGTWYLLSGQYPEISNQEEGSMYSLTQYVCSTGNLQLEPQNVYFGFSWNDLANLKYVSHYYGSWNNIWISPEPFQSIGTGSSTFEFSRCYAMVRLLQPGAQSSYMGLTVSTSGSGVIALMGYNLEYIGKSNSFTNSQIQNALTKSGLATASSVNEVKQGVNEVKQELNGVKEAQQETNNTLKDETAPEIDLSDIETSDTPISDLVTLPLTLLNSIYNGVSGSCSNWTLQLPFNHSVLLECFTISDYVGSSVALIIDTAICLFMAYRIVLLFIAVFDDITTLSDTYTNYVKRGRY